MRYTYNISIFRLFVFYINDIECLYRGYDFSFSVTEMLSFVYENSFKRSSLELFPVNTLQWHIPWSSLFKSTGDEWGQWCIFFLHVILKKVKWLQSHLSYYQSVDLRWFLYFLHIVFETFRTLRIFTLEILLWDREVLLISF